MTLDQKAFDVTCASLAARISEFDNIKAVVGVRTGGAVVSKSVYTCLLSSNSSLKSYEVGASRYATATKKLRATRGIFRFAPYFLLDFMRLLEHFALGLRMRVRKKVDRSVFVDNELLGFIEKVTDGCVFIIDDAVDSGSTLQGVVNALKKHNPLLDYKTAVITITQKKPVMLPDIYLYSNVLIRFPWSSDYKK